MEKLTAIVTGGSSGIGEEICRHLLQANATVVNLDIQLPQNAPGGDYHFQQVDLCNPEATRKTAADIVRKFPFNCLVNNAGGHRNPTLLEGVADQDFDHSINLHLRAALILAQAVVPGMKAGRFGRILSMSSRAILGKKSRTVYAGAKAALVGFTRTWALELGPFGITVNAIAPGPIITDLFNKNNPPEVIEGVLSAAVVGRGGRPDDVARAAMFFLSPENGFVTGQVLHVCGGSSLGAAPW